MGLCLSFFDVFGDVAADNFWINSSRWLIVMSTSNINKRTSEIVNAIISSYE